MISSSSPETARSPRVRRETVAALATFGVAVAVGAGVRFWQLRGRTALVWNDTADFLASSREPWLSTELWMGRRSPVAPVVLKLLDGDTGSYMWFQAVVAAACWAALAASVWTVLGPRGARVAGAAAVVAFSLTDPVTMWDQSALSESLAVSVLAVVVAAGVQVASRPTRAAVADLVVALAVLLGLRDSPAVAALAGALALGAVLAARALWAQHRDRPGPALATPLTALAAAALVLGVGVMAAADHGQRHVFPLRNMLQVRVLPYPDRVAWFADHGMPQADQFAGPDAREPFLEAGRAPITYVPDEAREGELAEWFAWLEEDGRATVARWVLTHPTYLFTEPFEVPERTFNNAGGDRQFYAFTERRKVPLVGLLDQRSWVVVLAGAMIAGYALGMWRFTPAFVAGAVTAALALPHGLVAWHSDGMETARHLVIPALQLHLGVLVMAIGLLPTGAPAPPPEPEPGDAVQAAGDPGVGSGHG